MPCRNAVQALKKGTRPVDSTCGETMPPRRWRVRTAQAGAEATEARPPTSDADDPRTSQATKAGEVLHRKSRLYWWRHEEKHAKL